MEQHGRADADAIAVNSGDERSFACRQRAQEPPDRRFRRRRGRRVEEVGEIVAGGEVLAFAAKGDRPGSQGRAAACSTASASAAYMATVIALRRSGRASVIASTAPFCSTRTCSLIGCSRIWMTRRVHRLMAGPSTKAGTYANRHEILRRHRRNLRNPRARRHRAARRRHHQPVARSTSPAATSSRS